MTLEIYVGTLTGYFTRALAAAARAAGGAPDAGPPPTAQQVCERVQHWRDHVNAGLVRNGHLPRPLDWPEALDVDAALEPLAVDGLRALKLLLVYADGGQCSVDSPEELPARPELDPRWVEAAGAKFDGSAYDQVLVPELWLPGNFDFTFRCPYPDGHEVEAGFVGTLGGQLSALDRAVFGGRLAEAVGPSTPGGGQSLRQLALGAATALGRAARAAGERSLPMLLHH